MTDLARRLRWAEEHGDVLFDVVRIYLGVGLFIKAIYFLVHRQDLVELIQSAGNLWFIPALASHVAILAHLAGGLSLALGLLTRAGALVQMPVLAGALLSVHLPRIATLQERQNVEFTALVLFLLVLIALRGGGPLSVDRRMSRVQPAGGG